MTLALYWRQGLALGNRVRFIGRPVISIADESEIQIGDRVVLCSDSAYTELGVNHPIILRTLRAGARVTIGADCGLSGTTICAALSVSIGCDCLVGANVIICDTDFHALQPLNRRYNKNAMCIAVRPVDIGNNVFLGANVLVLKGVTIGDNCVIGAGSVVVGDIPANSIAAGNPAVVIRLLPAPPV